MVNYIQPYDKNSPPNIGGAINAAIKATISDPDDWFCLTDHDIMFLLPDSKRQLEEILETTDFDILGPLTNRLAAQTQLVMGEFETTDLLDHLNRANKCSKTHYCKVGQVHDPLAAFCLCFRRSLWQELGGFPENNIQFDYLFCSRALREGKRLGVMTGIYVLHLYRMFAEGDPRKYIDHLV